MQGVQKDRHLSSCAEALYLQVFKVEDVACASTGGSADNARSVKEVACVITASSANGVLIRSVEEQACKECSSPLSRRNRQHLFMSRN